MAMNQPSSDIKTNEAIHQVLTGSRRWCVVHADCFAIMATMEDQSVTHIITDPPYLGARGESWETENVPLALPYEPATSAMLTDLAEQSLRLASVWTLVFNDYIGERVLRERLQQSKAHVVAPAPVCWVKPDGAYAPNGTAFSPSKSVEFMTTARRRKVKRMRVLPGAYVSEPYSPKLEILRTGGKPVRLMMDIIKDFTDEGDVIFDPFAGAGTTGVAAIRQGRRAILIERDERVAQLAMQRMQAEELGLSLEAHAAGQVSLFKQGEP